MFVICTIVCFVLGLITYMKEKILLNPITVLAIVYGVSSFLSGLRLYDTIEFSFKESGSKK